MGTKDRKASIHTELIVRVKDKSSKFMYIHKQLRHMQRNYM